MTDQIVSRDDIRAKARAAFERGDSRDSHNMNWHATALADWLEEYDRLALALEVRIAQLGAGQLV
jgi:hypothetical protein